MLGTPKSQLEKLGDLELAFELYGHRSLINWFHRFNENFLWLVIISMRAAPRI